MKIIELNVIEFGGLKNKRISLTDGINIVSGSNESGKSTVMLFVKFMLYGLPRRAAKGNTDKDRALSWDNHRAAGTMTVSHNGKKYLIERQATAQAKNDICSVTELSTGAVLGKEPFEIFTEVPAEVFESSCFVSQMRSGEINGVHTASAIENILSGADEKIDTRSTLERLDKLRKEYKHNRGDGGMLFETETLINELSAKKRRLTDKYLEFNSMTARLDRAEKSFATVSRSYEDSKRLLSEINDARILLDFKDLDLLEERRKELKDMLSLSKREPVWGDFEPDDVHVAALRTAAFAYRDSLGRVIAAEKELEALTPIPEKTKELAAVGNAMLVAGGKAAILEKWTALQAKADKAKRMGITFAVISALSLASSAVCAVLAPLACIPLGVGVVLFSILSALRFAAKRNAIREKEALCREYGSDSEDFEIYLEECVNAFHIYEEDEKKKTTLKAKHEAAIEASGNAFVRLEELLRLTVGKKALSSETAVAEAEEEAARLFEYCSTKKKLLMDLHGVEALISKYERELEKYDREKLLESVRIDIDSVDDRLIERTQTKERYDRERMELLDKEIRNLREALAGLRAGLGESPVDIGDRIEELEKKLNRDTEYYNALALAMKKIEEAGASMSGSVTPDISRRAGEMLSMVSGGAHENVQTTKNLELSVEQGGFLVRASLLSGGTRDAAYICLRIALMQKLFGKELPPLLLDEAFCQLDDERTKTLLLILDRLSRELMQCVIFTCHEREMDICRDESVKANFVVL